MLCSLIQNRDLGRFGINSGQNPNRNGCPVRFGLSENFQLKNMTCKQKKKLTKVDGMNNDAYL